MGTMHRRRPFSFFKHDDLDGSDDHHVRTGELRRLLREARRVTRRLEDTLAHRPLALLGAVGAGAFVLGALAGSRLARALAAVGVGFVLGRRAIPAVVRVRRRIPA
jgi:hypothetical protein